jgi:hypothetical protein
MPATEPSPVFPLTAHLFAAPTFSAVDSRLHHTPQQQQPSPAEAIETLLQQIVASANEAELATVLLNSFGTSEMRETALLSVTPAGTDPFDALDGAWHTIGVIFLLCVIVSLLLSSPLLSLSPSIASFYRYLWIVWFFFWVSSVLPPFGRSTRLTSTTTTTPAVQFAPALSRHFSVTLFAGTGHRLTFSVTVVLVLW